MNTIKYTNKHLANLQGGGYALYLSSSPTSVDDFKIREEARMRKYPDADPMVILEVRESTDREHAILAHAVARS